MIAGSRLAVAVPIAVSFGLIALSVPAATWVSSASLSLASAASALTLMASAALLGALALARVGVWRT
jgi:hypothetical protein